MSTALDLTPDEDAGRRRFGGWYGVEIRHLAALRAVARHGSFRRAAAALGFCQSAVSQQIRALEERVGTTLVDRPRRGAMQVRLTAAGSLLLVRTEEILAQLECAEADLAALAEDGRMLQVGLAADVDSRLLGSAVAAAVEQTGVEASVVRSSPDELARLVGEARVELALTEEPVERPQLLVEELANVPYVLVAPAQSGPRAAERISASALGSVPLIGSSAPSFARLIDGLRGSGIALQLVAHSNDREATLGLVAAGVGSALLPCAASSVGSRDVVVLETASDVPRHAIWLLRNARRPLSAPAMTLLAELRSAFARTDHRT